MRTVGEIVRQWRLDADMTQEEMARRTGFRQTYLSALECNRFTEPGWKRLGIVVRTLGHGLDELLDLAALRQLTAA